jgi:hypothetical protein
MGRVSVFLDKLFKLSQNMEFSRSPGIQVDFHKLEE